MQNTSSTTNNSRKTVQPEDNGLALENPGMGWVLHYFDNGLDAYGTKLAPSDALEDFPGITTIYLRLAWSYLEPEEGQYRWELVDTPAQSWISRGNRIAFRFTCSEWGMNATPDWVRAAGARGYFFTPGKGVDPTGETWEPDYNDPIFLEKHSNFLKAAAARYDGSPEVDFIDVGAFGIWGEMHNVWSTKLDYNAETVMNHLDLYAQAFKRTLLVTNSPSLDHGRDASSLAYARRLGMSFRDDSILVLEEELTPQRWSRATTFWPVVPVVLESQHYGLSIQDGWWKDGSGYLQAVKDYHASYVSIHWWPREFLAENQALVEQINRVMGYRIQLLEASWPEQIKTDEAAIFTARWRNAGVAPCLPGGYPTITLKDQDDGIVGVFVDESLSVATLPVAIEGTAASVEQQLSLLVSQRLAPGTYNLFISIGSRTGTPTITLPLNNHDGQKRYRLGEITIVAMDRADNER